jgi:membrane-bound lytic murein transglycosylase C
MKIIHYIAIALLALAPPAILLIWDDAQLALPNKKHSQSQQTSRQRELVQYRQKVDKGLKVYKQTYSKALEAHKKEVIGQWGEFKDPGPSVWVSYENSGGVRRSVDYQSGEVQVEMLVDAGTDVAQTRSELDEAVFRLMNTTEKEAYKSDTVANLVEAELAGFEDAVHTAEMSDERLFSLEDLISIQINHSGFFKVSSKSQNIAVTDIRPSAQKGKDIVRASFKVPHSIHQKAARYAAAVTAAAKKEKISDELIFAIMETESSFNPMAKSHIPAYGLMQIVPHTAGKDATNHLYGKPKILAPSYLYKPEKNIAIGAAYLHVLHYKYMRKVKNEESRMYCAIAAYNTGASNVARAFIKKASFNKAVAEINKLTPAQVYDKLRKYLPRQETRKYIEKVSRRMEKYL